MAGEGTSESVIILRERGGGTSVTVTARIDDDSSLTMEGQYLGEAPQRHLGDDEYEYFVRLEREHIGNLTLALLQERFHGSGIPTGDFMAWLKAKGIPYKFASF